MPKRCLLVLALALFGSYAHADHSADVEQLVQPVFDANCPLLGLSGQDGCVVLGARAGGEEATSVVDDRDAAWSQPLHAGRNQMLDGPDFAYGKLAADDGYEFVVMEQDPPRDSVSTSEE